MKTKYNFDAVIFDLDGVITQTALVHSTAWKEMFDHYLQEREKEFDEPFLEFTHENDYLKYVDGKPRYEGVKSFLESRNIHLPFGNPMDDVKENTYCGIGNRKNIVFNDILKRDGVQVFPSTIKLIKELIENGIHVGVASSSKNCKAVLEAANLQDLIETRVDGEVSAQLNLKGKPEADIFTKAADNLGVSYDRAVVVEDALSGVAAGKKGNFGLVLGLSREDNAASLYAHGADIVVKDIEEIGLVGIAKWFDKDLEIDNWSLTYKDYLPEKERSREALLSVGNGYFGTRGAMEEVGANSINYPGTYMSGVFNKLTSKVSGRDIENEDFVNVSNWLPITFKIGNGVWFDINKAKIINIERKIDFKTGILFKQFILQDDRGRETQIFTRRFASMQNPNIAGIHYCIKPLNYSGLISYKSTLEGNHINAGVARYADLNQKHLENSNEYCESNFQNLIVKTTESNIYIHQTARMEIMFNGEIDSDNQFEHAYNEGIVESVISRELKQGDYFGLMKTVFIEKSETEKSFEQCLEKFSEIDTFEVELDKSCKKWEGIWNEIDICIEGDRLSQKLIRLHLYHLMSGTSVNNISIDFGIPARGLTGEAYRGHIFWDELYILPFYFIHFPEVAKSILMYRFRRLKQARNYAKEFGYRGAMFPWQSGSKGIEETQKFHFNPISGDWGDDHSSLQRHVSLAIAYNIIQYNHFTEDENFMSHYGLEMLIEICRFWESKCQFDDAIKRYSIDKVMGPDEFHESYPNAKEGGLKDNAYTNVMTVWTLEKTIEIIRKQKPNELKEIFNKINFSDKEIENWKEISKKMNVVISKDGIISQYDGYFDLKDLDWDYYRQKYGNIHRMDRVLKAEGETPDAYKVAKQADTLMLFYNLSNENVTSIFSQLGYNLPEDYISKNLEYYLKRTSHGSTLSRVVHSYLATQLGRNDLSWSMFSDAITSDYNDIQGGTTAEGVHTGVMAGTIWIAISAFAGIEFNKDNISINPNLPDKWRSIKFNLKFKNDYYKIELTSNRLEITSKSESFIYLRGDKIILKKGVKMVFSLKS